MPRAGLTPEVVVRVAAEIADERGLEQLTLAALAARLGVAVPSLYKHVAGLDAVRRGVAIRALGELESSMVEAIAADAADAARRIPPVERLRRLASAYRAFAREHPGCYAATVRAPGPDDPEHAAAAVRASRVAFDVLGELGLTGESAVDAARSLRAALHGYVALEAAGGFGLPRDVDRSFERLVEVVVMAIATLGAGATTPAQPRGDLD